MIEVVRTTITGPIWNLQADVVDTSADPTKSWLVVTNADGSSVWLSTDILKIQASDDYKQEFTRLDAWLPNERISTIVHNSILLWLSITETFIYWWTAPNYYLISSTLS